MRALGSVLLIAAGLMVVLVVTLVAFGMPLGPSLNWLYEGALGSPQGRARSLVNMTPLLITGLGIGIAWRAGMINIGGEGQYVVGGLLGATMYKLAPNLNPIALNVTILVAGCVGGGLYASLAGWLSVRRGVQVIISTILLNFIAIQMLDWAVNGPLKERKGQLPMTDMLPQSAMLARYSVSTDLHAGVFYALALAPLCALWLFRSRAGFVLRVVGNNPAVAEANRLSPGRVKIQAMAISGALCGLAGGIQYTAVAGQLARSFSQDWGFLAIPVALLGGLNPLGTVLSAGYFGALFAGTDTLARFVRGGSAILFVIQALAVFGFVAAGRWVERRRREAAP